MAERSILDTVLEALQRPEAVATATLGNIAGLKNAPNPIDVLLGQEKYDPNRLFQDIEEEKGIDLTYGDEGDPSTFGNLINMARNVAFGAAIDPTSYLTVLGAPAKLASKLGATDATADLLRKAISKTRFSIGEDTARKIVDRGITGATLGALAYDPNEEDLLSNMLKIGLGAGVGLTGAGALARGAGRGLERATDLMSKGIAPDIFRDVETMLQNSSDVSRELAKKTGSQIPDPLKEFGDVTMSNAVEILRKARPKVNAASRLYQEEMGKVYDVLGGDQKAIKEYERVSNNLADISFRKRAEEIAGSKKKVGKTITYDEFSQDIADATMLANQVARDALPELIKNIEDPSIRPVIEKALQQQVNANRKFMDFYNEVYHAKQIREVVGFDFHKYGFFKSNIDEDEAIDAFRAKFSSGFKLRKSGETGELSEKTLAKFKELGGTEKDILGIAGDRMATAFLDEHEKAARMLVARFNSEVERGTSTFSKVLRVYDSATKLLKSGQLGLGISFFFNQIPENITRASIATSPLNIKNSIDSLVSAGKITEETAELFRKNLTENPLNLVGVAKTVSNKNALKNIVDDFMHKRSKNDGMFTIVNKMDNKVLNLLSDIGILNTNKISEYQRVATEVPELFNNRFGEQMRRLALQNKEDAFERTAQAFEKVADTIFKKSPTTVLGGVLEDSMKASVFNGVMKSILTKDEYKLFVKRADVFGRMAVVKDFDTSVLANIDKNYLSLKSQYDKVRGSIELAKEITERSFVDYSNIKPWERQVMSRLIPYWSYMSRSIPYFLRALANPDTVDKMVVAEKFLRGPGSRPSKGERAMMNEFLRQSGSSVLPNTNFFYTQTANPLVETLGLVSDPAEIGSKALFSLNPIAKALIEQGTDTDLFALASGRRNKSLIPTEDAPKKALGNEAGILEMLGGTVYKDPKTGQAYTTSEATARVSSLKRNLLPIPILDQIMKSSGNQDVVFGTLGSMRRYTGDIDKMLKDEQRRAKNRIIIENGLPVPERNR